MVWQVAIFLVALMTASFTGAGQAAPSRIAFGSCANQNLPQPVWNGINRYKPELFLFLGDVIYADTFSMQEMQQKYRQLDRVEGFQALKEYCPIEAIWDDHDYGDNDAGAEYSQKQSSQQIFLDFFSEPQDSKRRRSEGIYASRYYGPDNQRIQLILLDTRYFRSPWKKSGTLGRLYDQDRRADLTMLGASQWRWLRSELVKPARLRIIASGIQVINDEHGYESWGNFPDERQRFFDLIKDTEAQGVLILSGDRHFAEISKIDVGLGYPLYDFTSSGLTHSWLYGANAANSHRLFGFGEINFGTLSIDWAQVDPILLIEIRDVEGEVRETLKLRLSDLYRKS